MPTSRFDWLKRIKTVEREHSVIRLSANYLAMIVRANPAMLPTDLRVRDLDLSIAQLEATYIVRLFAEFETALRAFWVTSRANDPPFRTRDLVESIGVQRKIPYDCISNAHRARIFRNSLMHERVARFVPIPINNVRRYLCVFLNFLPLTW